MNPPAMHDPGHDAVVEVVHFQRDALEETSGGQRVTMVRDDTLPYKRSFCSGLRTMGSSVFFWNWTRRTLVTFSRSMSPFR